MNNSALSMKGTLLVLIVFLELTMFFILITETTVAATIRVPTEYSTIQEAIDSASDGDTVLVAPGTYLENINISDKDITLTSEYGPKQTIIDGNHVDSVVIIIGENTPLLIGFTVQNGYGGPVKGGGIAIFNSSPTITNNIITNNKATGGAGISVNRGSPIIKENVITKNAKGGGTGGIGGGGISIGGDGEHR